MPVVWGGDDHAIDSRFLREQFAVVGVHPSVGQFLDLAGGLQLLPVDVTDRDDPLIELGELLKEVAAHLPPHADAGKGEWLVISGLAAQGSREADPRLQPGRECRRGGRRRGEDTATEQPAAGDRMVGKRQGGHVLTPGARLVLGNRDRRTISRPGTSGVAGLIGLPNRGPKGVSLRQIRHRGWAALSL